MKWLALLRAKGTKDQKKTADKRQEALITQGREQFQKLLERGLNIPVALL